MNPETQNPKRKKIKEEDIWDISIYTDEEIIHNLLNMSNPTDRELEIKIWSSIQQYKTSPPNPENKRWLKFYEQIYHRLFSFSEDEQPKDHFQDQEEEEFPEQEQNITEGFIEGINSTTPISQTNQTQPPPVTTTTQKEMENPDTDSTKLVTQLQYATGNINPLLKETITRTLTIDSQYRDNKNESTTSFILNLTETIKNVVNISLYSIHVPFTWYTISTNYGSNYFYIKGSSPGIKNLLNNQYKIEIPSGNYNQITLATAVNTSLQTIKTNYTDICFGNTNIQYNVNNMLMTMVLDIQNIYNQHYYYLSFPTNPFYDYSGNTSLLNPDYINMRKQTIPSFLGLKNLTYNFDTIISRTVPYTISTASIYTISDRVDISNSIYPNNQIWIYQYQGSGIFDPSYSVVLASYSITIPPGSYSRTSLSTSINNLIKQTTFVNTTKSYFQQILIQDTSFSYFEMSLEINRSTTLNQQYLKTVIFFPDDTLNNNIWTGPCFQFYPLYSSLLINQNSATPIGKYFPFYQNEIYSEYPTLETNYVVGNNVFIIFKCITTYYDVSQNDYILTVLPSFGAGYILPEYITEVENAFNNITNIGTGIEISGNQLFNQSINKPFYIQNTDSIAYFDLDMNKNFNQDMYTIDISNSPLYTVLNIGKGTGGIINLTDLSSNNYTLDFSFNFSANYNMECITLFTAYPTPNTQYGNQNSLPFIVSPVYTTNNGSRLYSNLFNLQSDLNLAFTNYTSITLNSNPLQNSKITLNPVIQGIFPNNYYSGSIKFTVIESLTETDYSISFYDPSGSWSEYLFLKDNSGTTLNTDISYILSEYHISEQAYSEIYGDNIVLNQIIEIDNSNNIFSIVPLSTSESLQSQSNIYNYMIPNGIYTRDQLLNEINKSFQTYNDTYNCFVELKLINNSEYSYFYIEINKVYTSSDYSFVFFDSTNFQQCALGRVNIGNASWDSTLGWILGFRENTTYDLSNYITTPENAPLQLNDISTIIADTTCSTTLFNYFILTLDDYNQNHTNDGLVTITTREQSIPLPSYANRSNFICDPTTGLYLYTGITNSGSNNLTQNQIYSITEIMNNNVNASSLNGNVPISKYSYGPFISDVLAVIPIKTAGVTNGQTVIVDGGTLQTQNRKYFGPINLNRLLITLYDDRGHVVNLNNSNWSFTLLVDQIYKKSAASS